MSTGIQYWPSYWMIVCSLIGSLVVQVTGRSGRGAIISGGNKTLLTDARPNGVQERPMLKTTSTARAGTSGQERRSAADRLRGRSDMRFASLGLLGPCLPVGRPDSSLPSPHL